ncbi:alkaline phosphatase synthesis transcriptional regulatory protein PhoP [Clostridium magnum DSM 2767]|uniref:Stage 0 sporulation protein A homolog n=1 Tax=Clostridium magnum DSM 2767 TaxID=1121326 RepID=A0A162RY59_9CLOT|nr:response regulator transcription factor [Clostridium magnum]KZL90534.1 alkaline phosphatase synthesis transcriptional regulatory protein PhoP [Clostridium magnum DSM 2767]SHI04654.1 DNA-binding response regulator, OmpR family, contains REC and winged-helix (wHTH) domain [Clostridium magnum DSM 2767]
MIKETILIVDDEKEIRDLIGIYLENEGFRVIKACNGLDALKVLETEEVHLIILDIMMPKMDGMKACLKIRESRNMPIIMLSAKSEDMDKILGLTTGADDYLTKPFNPLELIARIKSQIRRYTKLNNSQKVKVDEIIEIDDLIIDTNNHEVKIGNKLVNLTKREFEILELLANNRGMVFSTEKIYESVWQEQFYESDNTVMVHIRKIREKIEENTRKPKYIKTVWGVGYKIEK